MLALLNLVKTLDFRWWIIAGLVTIIGIMGAAAWVNSVRIDSLKNEIERKQIEVVSYRQSIDDLKTAIEKQNDAIVELTTYTTKVEKTLSDTTDQNKKLNASAKELIKHINNSYVPPSCDGAFNHLKQFTNDYVKGWNK